MKKLSLSKALLLLTVVPALISALLVGSITIANSIRTYGITENLLFRTVSEQFVSGVTNDLLTGNAASVVHKCQILMDTKLFDSIDVKSQDGNPICVLGSQLIDSSDFTVPIFFDESREISAATIRLKFSNTHVVNYIAKSSLLSVLLLLLVALTTVSVSIYFSRKITSAFSRVLEFVGSIRDLRTGNKSDYEWPVQELQMLSDGLQDIISDTVANHSQIQELSKQAAVARLTQMLAHDVRKPFSLLEVVFKLLRQASNLSEVRAILEDTVPEVEQAYALTNGLINDVMEMNRQQKPIQKEEAIEPIIQSVLEEAFRIHDKVELKLEYRITHKHLLLIEAQKIRRVYANVVGNAIEAMKKYGGNTLWFSTEEAVIDGRPMAKLSIGNNGPGIPEEHLDQLFESFFSKKEGGTGLGLAIAKKVVGDHGGTIWCDSGALVHKVEFLFTLPLSDKPAEQTFQLPASSVEIIATLRKAASPDSRNHGSVIEDPRQGQAEEKIAAAVRKLGRKFKIAVLDDDDIYRAGVKGLIDESATLAKSIELVMFANGNSLLQQSDSFDGYICDVDLGAGSPNGYTVTATLRAQGILGGICIHSNRTLKEDMESSFQVGADQCLPKPMSRAHLVTFVNAFVLDRLQFRQEETAKPQEPARKPRIIVLDDSPVFLQAWILRLTDAAVESYRKPETFLDEIEKNPSFLDGTTAIITDNNFDKVDSRYTGLQLGELLKSRGVTVSLYLCSNGDYTDAELAGKVDFVVEKSPCSWGKISEIITKTLKSAVVQPFAFIHERKPHADMTVEEKKLFSEVRHDIKNALLALTYIITDVQKDNELKFVTEASEELEKIEKVFPNDTDLKMLRDWLQTAPDVQLANVKHASTALESFQLRFTHDAYWAVKSK